ncbi:putative uncharacterized protein DDB_G0268364 [Triplophysa dalaica]|uniref:putative uncharacterized protein DDB_G0268364 n=1 Tax=Triplophysa dalaica TaxID=1582913 RepID=UPI0024DFAB50|nr:putative uncharacterized protein DDB_G0268364 [Triplophysa dalaica]
MSSKEKNKKLKAEQEVDASAESAEQSQDQSEREMLLQKEYETLTYNLNSLKTRVQQLRRENEFLQNEADKTRMESVKYISYLSKRAEKRQNAIVTLSDHSHQELEELRIQKQKMQDEHEKQTNELKMEIMQKENELALLKDEITDLRNLKTLQQQQMCRIAELENDLNVMQSFHSESVVALKAHFLEKKTNYEQEARDRLQALRTSAIREASHCLMDYTKKVYEENKHLNEILKQLVQRYQDLQRQNDHLQKQQQQLQLERNFAQGLHCHRQSQQHQQFQTQRNPPQQQSKTYRRF